MKSELIYVVGLVFIVFGIVFLFLINIKSISGQFVIPVMTGSLSFLISGIMLGIIGLLALFSSDKIEKKNYEFEEKQNQDSQDES